MPYTERERQIKRESEREEVFILRIGSHNCGGC